MVRGREGRTLHLMRAEMVTVKGSSASEAERVIDGVLDMIEYATMNWRPVGGLDIEDELVNLDVDRDKCSRLMYVSSVCDAVDEVISASFLKRRCPCRNGHGMVGCCLRQSGNSAMSA